MLAYGPISWSSTNQTAIALSSIEAEYKGVVNATTQCLWLQGIHGEFGIEYDTSTVIYCDNQSTIQISIDLVKRQKTKHIEIHMHYIIGLVHDEVIALHYCTSSEQLANIFTKGFFEKTFNNLKSLLGIYDHMVKTD